MSSFLPLDLTLDEVIDTPSLRSVETSERDSPTDGNHGTIDITTLFNRLGLAFQMMETTINLNRLWGDRAFGFEHVRLSISGSCQSRWRG